MSVGKLCTFKVIFHDDIRRWKVDTDDTDSNRFQSLQTFVAEAFKIRDFQLQYVDDEGDKITLANNNDFNEALGVALTMKNALRVTVITQSNETKNITHTEQSDLDSTEIVYVQSDIETEMKADLNAKLQNSDIATVGNKAPDKQHSDIAICTVEKKAADKRHQTQRIRLRIESPPPQIECYLDGTQFSDEEEIEALGLDPNEWNLQLKFDDDNLIKRALCQFWAIWLLNFCMFFLLFCIGIFYIGLLLFFCIGLLTLLCVPCCWCWYTAQSRKNKHKKVILTEQKLIIKEGAYRGCECCLDESDWSEKIYSVPIEYERMTAENMIVSDSSCCGGCCGNVSCRCCGDVSCRCCGGVKELWFTNRNDVCFRLEGLSDPDGIRKLMLKISDEKKKGNIDAEIVAMNEREEMVAGAVSAEAALNRQIQLSHHNVAANDDIGLQVAETCTDNTDNVADAIVALAVQRVVGEIVDDVVDEIVGDVVDVFVDELVKAVLDGAEEND